MNGRSALLAWLKNRSSTAQTSEAAGLAGEPAHDLGAPANPPEGSLEEVRGPPAFAMSEPVARMDDHGVEVVGQRRAAAL